MKLVNSLLAITIALIFLGAKQWDGLNNHGLGQKATETYFLKAKVDGIDLEYRNFGQLSASFGPYIDNIYDGVLSASNVDVNKNSVLNSISILIRQKGKIGLGSYSGGKQFEYGFKGVTIGFMDAANSTMYITDTNNPQSFLKISEFTDTFIKGSFSGVLVNPLNMDKISITDGEFYIKTHTY